MKNRSLAFIFILVIMSGCATNNEETKVEKVDEEYEAYEAAVNYITTLFGHNDSESVNHLPYENSDIIKREDGFYFITSAFEELDTSSKATYNYEMLLDSNYEILDAYVPGSKGIFDKPIVYEGLDQSNLTNIKEKEEDTEPEPEKEPKKEPKKEPEAEENESVTSNDELIYENKEHGFKLTFPESWSGKIIQRNEEEAIVAYDYIRDGEVLSNIFSFYVFNESEYYGKHDGNIYITTRDEKVYAYNIQGDPPEKVLENEQLLKELMQMVNEDVPKIMESISFN